MTMTLHKPEVNLKLGLLYCLGSSVFWGTQTIAMSLIVKRISPSAVAFYKLLTALIFLFFYIAWTKKIPRILKFDLVYAGLFVIAGAGLAISYGSFAWAFRYVSPGNAQIYIQSARILFILASIYVFKEPFSKRQWFGLLVLVPGFYLFFQNQIEVPEYNSNYGVGVGLVLISAVGWVLFGLTHKQLLTRFKTSECLLGIYVVAVLALCPFSGIDTLMNLALFDWLVLLYIFASNLLAFVCFSKALTVWEASKVSGFSCTTPISTNILIAAAAFAVPWLGIQYEALDHKAIFALLLIVYGAFIVCSGSKTVPLESS